MKYLVGVLILLSGVAIGFFLGRINHPESETISSDNEKEYITEYVTDTVVQTKTVHVPTDAENKQSDTLDADSLITIEEDSLSQLPTIDDTLIEEDIHIRREEKIAERRIDLVTLNPKKENPADTTIKELLGIENKAQKSISVEFWESPLHYSGYKLSSKKLILFGLSPQLKYTLYKREDDYYLHAQEVFYAMRETADFVSYKEVDEAVVFND